MNRIAIYDPSVLFQLFTPFLVDRGKFLAFENAPRYLPYFNLFHPCLIALYSSVGK